MGLLEEGGEERRERLGRTEGGTSHPPSWGSPSPIAAGGTCDVNRCNLKTDPLLSISSPLKRATPGLCHGGGGEAVPVPVNERGETASLVISDVVISKAQDGAAPPRSQVSEKRVSSQHPLVPYRVIPAVSGFHLC